MISVDTNVLVRILVDDTAQPGQVRAARETAKKAGAVFVPQVVQVETVWVLETAYGLDRKTLIDILEHLACNRCFVSWSRKRCTRRPCGCIVTAVLISPTISF